MTATLDLLMDLLGRISQDNRHGEENGMRPREVVKSSSLDIFKTQMDTALKNLQE